MAVSDRKHRDRLKKSVKHNASIVKVLGACILVCIIFAAGFFLRGNGPLMDSLGFSAVLGAVSDDDNKPADPYSTLSGRIGEVEDILGSEGVGEYDLDGATKETLAAFAKATDDEFMRYYDEKSYQAYLSDATDSSMGVGVLFVENDGSCFAADVLPDSKASDSGVLSGDYVISVDGDSRDSWTLPDLLSALAREDGETVLINWGRRTEDGEEVTYTTSLTYHKVDASNITYEMEGTVAIIDVNQISSDSSSVMKETVEKVVDNGATSIVLDLRGVPGGYLTQAVGIASLFMESGVVVQVKTSDSVTTKSTEGSTLTDLPLVVLVDKQTSGSAEVLAAALQESDRATIVGTVTQGKGSVQVMQPLSFGGALRYTAATYLTPRGRAIDGNGVTPDVVLSSSTAQTTRAIEVAESLVG